MTKKTKSPIKAGWRGCQNGWIDNADGSHIEVSEVTLRLDRKTAWALCNHLTDEAIETANSVDGFQVAALKTLGAALGRLIDHHSANNDGRDVIKE